MTDIEIQEATRRSAFRACPILSGFLAVALEDLQYSESDEACEQEREERDSGTIYDCPAETFDWARDYCAAFLRAQLGNVQAVLEAQLMDWDRIGSTLYLSAVGHGVSFTDDGRTAPLEAMERYANAHRIEQLYFGDDGRAYPA